MKLVAFWFFLIGSTKLFGQYDYFDSELGHDSYERVYSRLAKEHVIGSLKELKLRSTSGVNLHLVLNKNGQIIEEREYVDTLRLSRIATYSNQKIIKETEYYLGNPTSYVFYKYHKSGRLVAKAFSKSVSNRKYSTRVTYQYDDNGRLVQRKYHNSKGGFDRFVYEGDSVIWKLIFNDQSVLNGVNKKINRTQSEVIILYKLDTTLDIDFSQRIKPTRELQHSWNSNGTLGQWTEFEYDSVGRRTSLSIKKSEFKEGRLVKTTSIHNTALLKGEFVTEFIYSDRGPLELEISKHDSYLNEIKYEYDERGNLITQGGFTYRFLYDRKGNWITKQRFYKKGLHTKILSGVTETKKYTQDSWINEEERQILYFE
jgi:hypothetical protein